MDLKNTAILLIFLLCVLGLIAGAYWTEHNDNAVDPDKYDEIIHEDSNGTITITLEVKEKPKSPLDSLFEPVHFQL